jgi:glycosyltransferase involved in cell wall biosynthesis
VDQVHSFWFSECAYVGSKLSKKLNIPHSCTFMGQDALQENRYLKKIKRLPQIITLSGYHAAALKENAGIESDFIIPWGIEELEIDANVEKTIDILGVGNLIPLKAYDGFIRVLKEVKHHIPEIKAEIIGEGPELENLQKLIDKSELRQNILLRGKMDRAGVLKSMRRSKCLLHLSHYESFGMVLIEAQAMGAKVFSANVGIAAEAQGISIVGEGDASNQIIQFLKNNQHIEPFTAHSIKVTVQQYLKNVLLANN